MFVCLQKLICNALFLNIHFITWILDAGTILGLPLEKALREEFSLVLGNSSSHVLDSKSLS